MEIHILLAGEQIGPFSAAQVRQYLGEGLVTPTDLATCDGMEDWQTIDFIMAHLPEPEPVPADERAFPDTAAAGSPDSAGDAPEHSFPMPNDTPPILESESAPPPANRILPLTASQKTKPKLGKIVIQPILPLEATGSTRKKPRSGKTALTLEPLRPTTALPPVTGFARKEKEKKSEKNLIRTGTLSLNGLPERRASTPSPTATAPAPAPAASTESSDEFQPPSLPPEGEPIFEVALGWIRQASRWVVYACCGLAFILTCLFFAFLYLTSSHHGPVPVASPAPPENHAPAPSQAETPEATPQTAADFSARGFARQSKGDLDGAMADYNQALNLDPKNIQALYRRGLALQAKGDWAGAMADYNAILTLNPRNADAFSSRGFVKQARGDTDGALADYAEALLINPKIPVVYYNEGLIEVQKGDLDGAISAYSHALDLDPKMAIAYYNRGVVKDTEGNLDGAIADYTQTLILNPKIARAYCDRGTARQSKGDAAGALADYDQALALDPKMAVAYFNRGLIKIQKGDFDGAISDASKTIDLSPKNGQAYFNRGMALLGKGNLDEAMADLRKFCELAPRDATADSARLYLWLIASRQNLEDHANEELASSLQNDWNSSPEDLSSKIAAFLLGHISEGELIANAASPDPSREPGQFCKAWYFAGMKRLLAGDTAAATFYFNKCLGTGQKGICEYLFAQGELQTLGRSPKTPPSPGH